MTSFLLPRAQDSNTCEKPFFIQTAEVAADCSQPAVCWGALSLGPLPSRGHFCCSFHVSIRWHPMNRSGGVIHSEESCSFSWIPLYPHEDCFLTPCIVICFLISSGILPASSFPPIFCIFTAFHATRWQVESYFQLCHGNSICHKTKFSGVCSAKQWLLKIRNVSSQILVPRINTGPGPAPVQWGVLLVHHCPFLCCLWL